MPGQNDNFRDRVATVNEKGQRNYVYAKKPQGKFYNARSWLAILQVIIFTSLPFIKINGHQFFVLNFIEREFVLFGVVFGPHDFHLFGLTMIAFIVFIVLFTVVFGRIFCGWLCPQTLFMEMIFRRLEYWIEGDAGAQQRLKAREWDGDKIRKRLLKHSLFFVICFLIVHVFVAYFVGGDRLLEIAANPGSNLGIYFGFLVSTFILYFEYTRFREQICTFICPYGRLQGVLLDKDSLVITYDYKRGEPRSHFGGKGVERSQGDCIDCGSCVRVCPTGIDIRNGTQLECVNCTACIDACDRVMNIVGFEPGLIRYASQNEIESGKRSIFTARSIGYSIVLFVLVTLISLLMANRSDFEVTILRMPGVMWQTQPNGEISNIYDMKIVNKTYDSLTVSLRLAEPDGRVDLLGGVALVEPHKVEERKLLVLINQDQIKQMSTPIEIDVLQNGNIIDKINTTFLAKVKKENE